MPMAKHAFVLRAAKTNSLLVATDLDGTIADITDVPARAFVRADALAALAALSRAPGVTVAVVSGRDMASLRKLTTDLDHVFRVAEHGAFIEAPDGTRLVTHVVPIDLIERLVGIAERIAARHPGMRIERKTSGVSVHLREVDPKDKPNARASVKSFRRVASRLGMTVMEGRSVIEARAASVSKEAALDLILGGLSSETFVLYAGDDTTDEGAMTLAHSRGGVGIYVASVERPVPSGSVDVVVGSPREWAEWLEALARARAITSR